MKTFSNMKINHGLQHLGGTLRSGNKADLVVEFEALPRPVAGNPQVTAKILDGDVIVLMLYPRNSKTFEDYCKIYSVGCLHPR